MKQHFINFMSFITLLLVILKIVDVITLSWFWIFSPIILSLIVGFATIFVDYLLMIVTIKHHKNEYEEDEEQ